MMILISFETAHAMLMGMKTSLHFMECSPEDVADAAMEILDCCAKYKFDSTEELEDHDCD